MARLGKCELGTRHVWLPPLLLEYVPFLSSVLRQCKIHLQSLKSPSLIAQVVSFALERSAVESSI